jgi:hypothetical protein
MKRRCMIARSDRVVPLADRGTTCAPLIAVRFGSPDDAAIPQRCSALFEAQRQSRRFCMVPAALLFGTATKVCIKISS